MARTGAFRAHIDAFKLGAADTTALKDLVKKAGGVKVVGIGEDWCPDVHRGLPVLAKMAEAGGMELRFFPRDKNLDIINLFLNQGKYQSIPVFAFFDGKLNHLSTDRAPGLGDAVPERDQSRTGQAEAERRRYAGR